MVFRVNSVAHNNGTQCVNSQHTSAMCENWSEEKHNIIIIIINNHVVYIIRTQPNPSGHLVFFPAGGTEENKIRIESGISHQHSIAYTITEV